MQKNPLSISAHVPKQGIYNKIWTLFFHSFSLIDAVEKLKKINRDFGVIQNLNMDLSTSSLLDHLCTRKKLSSTIFITFASPHFLQADIAPTKLRLNDNYTVYYYNYSRLIFTGILPFMALIKFNYQIHHAIKIRRQNMRGNQWFKFNGQVQRLFLNWE